MTLSDYQAGALTTALPQSRTVEYMLLGLCNEAGEVAGKWKKKIRDGSIDTDALRDEIGDVLWYVAGLCSVLDESLEEVASRNLQKLQDRARRSVITGSGDAR